MIAWLAAGAQAGGWTKEVGQFYTKAGVDVYDAYRYVSAGDTLDQSGSYLSHQYSLYGEAGVLPGYKGQLAIKLPAGVGIHGRKNDPALCGTSQYRATTGRLGDAAVAAQVALHRKLPIAAAVDARIPMYANGTVGAGDESCGAIYPKPGDGQVDLTTWVYGGATPIKGGFTEAGIGYRYRTDWFVGWSEEERTGPGLDNRVVTVHYVDGIAFTAKYGQSFGKVLPIVGIDGVVSLKHEPIETQFTRQYATVSASALIDVAEGLAIEPRLATELTARNSSLGVAGGLGVSYRR